MREDIELTRVLGTIYNAALDPELWTDALAGVAAFVGGPIGAVGAEDQVGKLIDLDDIAALDLHGGPRHEVRGTCDSPATGPEKPEPGYMPLGVVGSEANETADHEMRRRVALIAPHMRRAILIGEAIDQKAREATIFAGILDSLRAGLFLIDGNAQIIHANAAGRGILAASDVLRSIGGRLVARDAAFNHALRDIIAGNCDPASGGNGLALPLTARDGECHVAHILVLGEGARDRAGMPSQAVAAVFVCDAALEISSSADVIQRAFRLTPTELRVLFAIVNVGGIPQVAAALGVAVSTIKTHVGRLYDKTGAVRQADLVKLVVGFLNPLVA